MMETLILVPSILSDLGSETTKIHQQFILRSVPGTLSVSSQGRSRFTISFFSGAFQVHYQFILRGVPGTLAVYSQGRSRYTSSLFSLAHKYRLEITWLILWTFKTVFCKSLLLLNHAKLVSYFPFFLDPNWYLSLTSKISSNTGEISSKTNTWLIYSFLVLELKFPILWQARSFIITRNFRFHFLLAPNQNLYFSIRKCVFKKRWKKTLTHCMMI